MTMQRRFLIILGAVLCGFNLVYGQNFTLTPTQIDLSVAPSFNHTPVRVSIVTNAPGLNLNNIVVSSDAAWVAPSVDPAASKIVLTFATANLINQSYTATITASLGGQTNTLFVRAFISPLNIFKLKDDPLRSRTYGIQQNNLTLGSVVVLDPVTTNYIGNVTVGRKPSDFAESADGRELFVINSVDATLSVIDLASLTVKETLTLPAFDNWGQNDTTANIAAGPGNILYYTDGAWAPALRVLDRGTMQVLQTVYSQGASGEGFGDLGLTSDKRILFGWMQYGWSAGLANSYVMRFTVAADGQLTLTDKGDSQYNSMFARDPLETPVLVSSDDQTFFIKGFALGADSASNVKYTFPTAVYSITPGGEIAVTATAVYETATGAKLADLPGSATVQAISSDYARFIYFDTSTRSLNVRKLSDLIGQGILNRDIVPADASITLAPARLQWSPLPGVDRYNVYLGTSETGVANADTNSPVFLGTTTQPYFQLSGPLTPGTTYFWRVDAVTQFDVARGDVHKFTVSLISCSTNEINAATVQGHRDFRASFSLNSANPGIAWQASASQSWVSLTQASGATPATVELVLDASQLSTGLHQASVTISSGGNTLFSIPIKFRVEPLNLTVAKSEAGSVFAYAISEDTSATPARAYLLEINMLTESIRRVVKVGSSATDLAVHKADNRIYVPNWLTGALLAIDLNTFQQVRSYAFSPFGGVGYSENDIYRVSAGGTGRVIWEEEDQWVDINIFDTVAGTNIASAFVRQGGGDISPDKRYYYHGDDNSSGAEIHKFDLTGDRFTELAHVRVANYSYYGSRTVLVSHNGNRVFWNGGVFDPDLRVEWTVADQIYAASADGRYAFGNSALYDIDQRTILATVTPATPVKAFNDLTGKLVYKGTNGLAFFKLNSQERVVPTDGSIIASLTSLGWQALPVDATYQVYLGQSSQAVSTAGTNSPLFLGEVASTDFVLNPLPAGAYYWRVDAVTQFGTLTGAVHSFVVSPISPSIQQINAVTFPGRPATATLTLSSAGLGGSWQAAADANWISLSQTNGTTPATIQVTLDPSAVPPLSRTGLIVISGSSGPLFSIPVQLVVEPLYLTVIKSDPASHKVYAISEDPSRTPSHAYLLEINTLTESIERVVSVGSSATDLAVHNGDNRLYVPNWQSGALLAIDLSTFQQVRSYSFSPFGGTGTSQGDVYRVAAGAPGRVVVEEEDQWIDISLFNTTSGTILTNTFVREGGGAFGGNGRYYYHGDNNSSGAEIHKFDVLGDAFRELAHIRVDSVNYYGSRTVVVSEDGSHVFWNGSMFGADLVELWTIRDEIFSTSSDGRYAFSQTKIYDTAQQRAVLSMPVNTRVSAFNSTSRKLVVQTGPSVAFFALTDPLALPAPVLSAGTVTYNSVQLTWTDHSLEDSFTLQRRVVGSATWQDVATLPSNQTQFTVTGLAVLTSYEFRIKADAPGLSSAWSAILPVTTPGIPPATPSLSQPVATTDAVMLSWSNPADETGFVLERSDVGISGTWSLLAALGADVTAYTDSNVVSLTTYYYRIKATNTVGESTYSAVRAVTVPAPAPPSAPTGLVARPLSSSSVRLTWNDVATETGYRIERRTESPTSWSLLVALPANTTSYIDANVVQGTQYFYRVQAFNNHGNSPYSSEAGAVPAAIVTLIEDDFDPGYDPAVWASISGGVATNGGQGFRGSKALWFGASGVRSATTVPLDLSLGGTLEFAFRAGNELVDGAAFWNNSETGESVAIEYSKDQGVTWSVLQTLNTVYPSLSSWTAFSITIPAAASTPNTQLRWRQLANSGTGFDTWALEDLSVQGAAPAPPNAPPFITSSPDSSTSITVVWIDADRASSYIIERRQGTNAWTVLATQPASKNYYTDDAVLPGTTYSYRVKAANAGGVSPYSPTTTSATRSQLEEWFFANFGTLEGLTDAAMQTPGPDGTRPLLRFAFNLNATEPSRTLVPGQSITGFPATWLDATRNRLCVEFVRRKASTNPDVVYDVQFCGSLPNWLSSGTQTSVTSIDALWERVRYEDTVSVSQAQARFCRVTVRLP